MGWAFIKQKQMFNKRKILLFIKILFLQSFNVFQRKTRTKYFYFNYFYFVALIIYFSLEKLKLKGVRFVCYVAFRKHCYLFN